MRVDEGVRESVSEAPGCGRDVLPTKLAAALVVPKEERGGRKTRKVKYVVSGRGGGAMDRKTFFSMLSTPRNHCPAKTSGPSLPAEWCTSALLLAG